MGLSDLLDFFPLLLGLVEEYGLPDALLKVLQFQLVRMGHTPRSVKELHRMLGLLCIFVRRAMLLGASFLIKSSLVDSVDSFHYDLVNPLGIV